MERLFQTDQVGFRFFKQAAGNKPFPSFEVCFDALTDHNPMRWQARLFKQRMVSGDVPPTCDLPTGLGKTSVVPIWLIALASQERDSGVQPLPRRLVYIVNRRTVVDQATDVVEKMRERLRNPHDDRWIKHEETLRAICCRLRMLSVSDTEDDPFGVSTLRGELADNEEWKADPARPAIIVGTIDMIGSKLLFNGYGDGQYHRTHHAGLIGQDVLIVHDEAHLSPAFDDLLRSVEREQQREHGRGGDAAAMTRPIRVMALSATARSSADPTERGKPFGIEDEDDGDAVVQQRLSAHKWLRLVSAGDEPSADVGAPSKKKVDLAKSIAEQAVKHHDGRCRVLVYVRSPETAVAVSEALIRAIVNREKVAGIAVSKEDASNWIGLLTGTIRGYERDQLAKSDLFKQFKSAEKRDPIPHTLYLISTSAGEVGVDFDADHLVCDLTTLDSLAQRFGRVNRLGGDERCAQITVVCKKVEKKGEPEGPKEEAALDAAIAATAAVLKKIPEENGGRDVSPAALRKYLLGNQAEFKDEAMAAFSPPPAILPATDILFDAWALTSIQGRRLGCPEVEPYLHGVAEYDPSETYVVWRKEVMLLNKAEVDAEALRDWYHACRIEARERLRDRTDRVKSALGTLLKTHRKNDKDESRDFRVVVLNGRGDGEWRRLSEVVEKDFSLAYRTIVLPVEAGGLKDDGMLDGSVIDQIPKIDVAEATVEGGHRQRWLHIQTADGEKRYERVLTGEKKDTLPQGLREQERICLQPFSEGAEDESESRDLVILTKARTSTLDNPERAKVNQALDDHLCQTAKHADRIAETLGLDKLLKDALVAAARWHDRGKDRPVWQRYACNPEGSNPLAKSKRYRHWRDLRGYRHEFGSLLNTEACKELRDHYERDLILHLIASHHDWARPHFKPQAFDNEKFTTAHNEQAAAEVMRRFARLQQRFGRWGLAWLESLLRCADIAASKAAASVAPGQQEEGIAK